MTCIKTGADVFSVAHGGTLHGDLYYVEGAYVLHHTGYLDFEKESYDYKFEDQLSSDFLLDIRSVDVIVIASTFVERCEND